MGPVVLSKPYTNRWPRYTVATNNYPPPSPNADGSKYLALLRGGNTTNECRNLVRPPPTTSWHTIFCFSSPSNTFLRTIPKGAHVYVEAAYELRDADPDAEAGTPNAQRQIFLRHGACLLCFPGVSTAQTVCSSENIRVLKYPADHRGEEEHQH